MKTEILKMTGAGLMKLAPGDIVADYLTLGSAVALTAADEAGEVGLFLSRRTSWRVQTFTVIGAQVVHSQAVPGLVAVGIAALPHGGLTPRVYRFIDQDNRGRAHVPSITNSVELDWNATGRVDCFMVVWRAE